MTNEYVFDRTTKKKTKIGDFHFENMGKGLLEHLWHGKTVHYKPDGMFTEDGLWYYLNLFNIDVNKEQTISGISKRTFMHHLFYKIGDILYQMG